MCFKYLRKNGEIHWGEVGTIRGVRDGFKVQEGHLQPGDLGHVRGSVVMVEVVIIELRSRPFLANGMLQVSP
jgi:hypothetical protein